MNYLHLHVCMYSEQMAGQGSRGWGVGGVGGATALQSKRPEWAASADPGARTAPHWGRRFRQGHRLEQADQG